LIVVLLAACPIAHAQEATADEAAVRAAMITAVKAKLQADADVRLDKVKIVCGPAAAVVAIVEPGSRLGRVMRFTLRSAIAQKAGEAAGSIGYALAEVRASASHIEVGRPVARGSELTVGDLVERDDDLGAVPLAPLPVLIDAVGTHAARDLQPGEVVTTTMLRTQPLVRSGQVVRTRATVGRIEVTGSAVAQQSGQRNDRIKLINPESKKTMTGTITSAGEVVIVHEI
jgi:flagella basal body P-ring formation protein FlgA